MNPWPSFYFTMVATVIFSLVFIGADAPDPLLLFAQLCSFSGQVRKLSLGKMPSLISGRMARALDLSAVVELGRQTRGWVRNASMSTVSVYAGPALFFVIRICYIKEKECLRPASVLCVVDLSTWWCRYTCLLFTDLSSSNLFLVWMHSLWMVYYSFLGRRALGTPWLFFSSVFLLWLGIVTFWKLF